MYSAMYDFDTFGNAYTFIAPVTPQFLIQYQGEYRESVMREVNRYVYRYLKRKQSSSDTDTNINYDITMNEDKTGPIDAGEFYYRINPNRVSIIELRWSLAALIEMPDSLVECGSFVLPDPSLFCEYNRGPPVARHCLNLLRAPQYPHLAVATPNNRNFREPNSYPTGLSVYAGSYPNTNNDQLNIPTGYRRRSCIISSSDASNTQKPDEQPIDLSTPKLRPDWNENKMYTWMIFRISNFQRSEPFDFDKMIGLKRQTDLVLAPPSSRILQPSSDSVIKHNNMVDSSPANTSVATSETRRSQSATRQTIAAMAVYNAPPPQSRQMVPDYFSNPSVPKTVSFAPHSQMFPHNVTSLLDAPLQTPSNITTLQIPRVQCPVPLPAQTQSVVPPPQVMSVVTETALYRKQVVYTNYGETNVQRITQPSIPTTDYLRNEIIHQQSLVAGNPQLYGYDIAPQFIESHHHIATKRARYTSNTSVTEESKMQQLKIPYVLIVRAPLNQQETQYQNLYLPVQPSPTSSTPKQTTGRKRGRQASKKTAAAKSKR